MKRLLTVLLTLLILGCDIQNKISDNNYSEYNPDSSIAIDFFSKANKIVFGTSTEDDITQNGIEFDNVNNSIRVIATNSEYKAGKVTESDDGISYSFIEVDADKNFTMIADIKVLCFGGTGLDGEVTSNGQESFGIMARDYIPQYPGKTIEDLKGSDSYYIGEYGGFGNTVFAGAVKRGMRVFLRKGVTGKETVATDPNVDPSLKDMEYMRYPAELSDYSDYPTVDSRPEFPLVNGTYRITLEKNNNGFSATITPPAEHALVETEFFLNEPEILTSIVKDKYYVGFFAARSAEILVTNINYTEIDRIDNAPYVELEPGVITPTFSILSPDKTADDMYKLYARSNVEGYITVKQIGYDTPVVEFREGTVQSDEYNKEVIPYSLFDIPTYELKTGDNIFEVVFYPSGIENIDNTAIMGSNEAIKQTFIVEKRQYQDGTEHIYVSPDGTAFNDGSINSPLDVNTAIAFTKQGQTIKMISGTYKVLKLDIAKYNNGTHTQFKTIEPQYPESENKVVIDFERNLSAKGAVLAGNYWNINNINITGTPSGIKGLQIMGHNNTVSWVRTYSNGSTGLQISGTKLEPREMWPKNNTIEYCESYNNKDDEMINADGFAAKLTVGEGNIFIWCVAHNNSDDGWDLFTKNTTKTIKPVTIKNCITYRNGFLMDGTQTKGGRNGFKLGGEGLSVIHLIENCLSFQNGAHGFTSNSNPAISIKNATSFDNGGVFNKLSGTDSRNFTIYNKKDETIGLLAQIEGLLSLYSEPSDGVYSERDKIEISLPIHGFGWGINIDNPLNITSNINGAILSTDDVISTTPPLYDDEYPTDNSELVTTSVTEGSGFIKRYPIGHEYAGEFIIGGFMKLKSSSYDVGADFN